MKTLTISFLILFLSTTLFSQSRNFELKDMNEVIRLSNPQLSPDGAKVAYMLARNDYDNNRVIRELRLVDVDGGEDQAVVFDRDGLGNPQWSPDGQHLSFLASAEKGRQIFLLPLKGGEARQLTHHTNSIIRFEWNPSGTHIAFIGLKRAEKGAKSGPDSFKNAFEIGSAGYLQNEAPTPRHVFVVDLTNGETEEITSEGKTVGTELSTSLISWSPDGNQIAFTVFPSAFPGDSDLGKNYSYNLTKRELNPCSENQQREGSPTFAADGAGLYYSYPRDGTPANVRDIYYISKPGAEPENVTRKLDRTFGGCQSLPNGSILLGANDGLKRSAWIMSKTGRFEEIPMGVIINFNGLQIGKTGALAFVGSDRTHPGDIFYKQNSQAPLKQLTHHNDKIAGLKQGSRQAFGWKSTDGFEPDGVLTFPPDFDPTQKYPLVLAIHGGPTGSSILSFNAFAQVLAAQGWIVFQPNYRGSNNLGNAFQSAIANDAAEGPGEDVMTGVEALKNRPYIDQDKIAVSGWSYGGWMTAWLIGRYPEVWKTAVAGAAPVDYTDMYSLSDLNRMRRHAITDSPYKDGGLEKAMQQSPLMHLSKIRTPTLIMSKTRDARVSITGSYKLFHALRDNGVPVQFIGFPGGGHSPRDPVNRLDVNTRWVNWLRKYLKP